MVRKSLFWGLTLILIAALVSLVIRGRRMEKEQAEGPAEVVRQASILPTRVLAPQDLEIVSSTMQLNPDHAASHGIEIKNHGKVPFSGLLLRFTYEDHVGNTLLSKTYALERIAIPPAQVFRAPDIVIAGVPAATQRFQVFIQYAEMEPAGPVAVK